MAFDAGSVIAKLKADLSDFQAGLKKAQEVAKTATDKIKDGWTDLNKGIEAHEKGIKSITVAFGVVAAAGVVAIKGWTTAAGEADVEMAKFNATLRTMGSAGEAARDVLLDAARAVTKLGFDDEQAANSMANFYQKTGDTTEAIKLNTLAMDLARAKSLDLGTASSLVTQVMAGGGRVLKQYGIDIKDTATPMQALAELQKRVAGQANEFVTTFPGKLAVMNTRLGEFKERLGNALIPVLEKFLAIGERILDWFDSMSPQTVDMIAKITLVGTAVATLVTVFGGLLLLIPALTAGFTAVGAALTLMTGPIGIVIAAIALFAGIVAKKMGDVQNAWKGATDSIQADVNRQSDTWNAWNLAAAKLADNEQEYARLRAKAQYYILQSTLLTESQIAAIRSGASQANLDAIQANIDGNNKWAREAATAAIDYAKSHTVNMTKVNAALTTTTAGFKASTGAVQENTKAAEDSAKAAMADMLEMNKNRQKMVKDLVDYKTGIDTALKSMAEEHRTTTESMKKDISGLQTKLLEMTNDYRKDIQSIKDGLADNLGKMQSELDKSVLNIKVRLQQEEGQIKGDTNRSIAEKFVAQEAEVAALKLGISKATTFAEKQDLEKQLAEKQKILDTDKQYVVNLGAEIAEVKRIASLTEIQRIVEESAVKIKAAQDAAAADIAAEQAAYAERTAIAQKEAKESEVRRTADFMAERLKLQQEIGEKQKALGDEIFLYNAKEKAIIEIRNQSVKIYADQIAEMVRFTDRSVNAMIARYNALNSAIQNVGRAKTLNNLIGTSDINYSMIGRTPNLPDLKDILKDIQLPSSMPKMAQGGIVSRPTIAMIGEGNEPEAVVPLSKLQGMGGVHIHLHDSVIASVEAATELFDSAIRRVQSRVGV